MTYGSWGCVIEATRQKGRRSRLRAYVEDFLPCLEDDVVVEVDLIGACAGTRLRHGIHGVIPARPLLESLPVRRPAEVRRIDVGGEPLLEAMQLIGSAKMHLAAEHRLIAGAAQIMREGGNLRRKLRGIVVGADGRDLPARQEREPRGGAQRAVAIERIEHDAARGQRVDVRGLREAIAVRGQRARRQLIGHQNQEIGSACHGGSCAHRLIIARAVRRSAASTALSGNARFGIA
jgi:hypothetical protein